VLRKLVITLVALAAGVALAALPTASGSAAPAAAASKAKPAYLTVEVRVGKIVARGHATKATGVATAALAGPNGGVTKVRQRVTLSAAKGGSCRVLHLFLEKLDLTLLGLNAHLDKVNLDITGKRHGGVLGSLFCKLAGGLKGKIAAKRAINARLAKHPMRAFKTRARLAPQATASQASPTCQVLDLVLGPLNLDLLGLVVDLNQVHLSVTATRGGGVLGDLFCKLADEAPPAQTTQTTQTTATA
jgi:hypothetical protein